MNPQELIGNDVTVTNPQMHSTWKGRAVAISEHPVILIEDDSGHRLMLPLAWAKLDRSEICDDDRYIDGTFYMCDIHGDHEVHRDSSADVSWRG